MQTAVHVPGMRFFIYRRRNEPKSTWEIVHKITRLDAGQVGSRSEQQEEGKATEMQLEWKPQPET